MLIKVTGTGAYTPKRIVTNKELEAIVDTSDEWISSRTGIKERHIADKESESVCTMAAEAAMAAIKSSNIDAANIDMIITATSSSDTTFPSCACVIQKEIGAVNAVCFDVSAACSGFIYAMSIASAYMISGIYKNILLIGSEKLSSKLDWKDRGTCVLFGDGAGAVMLQTVVNDTMTTKIKNNMLCNLQSDGSKNDVLVCRDYITMNGQEVFKFAVKKVPESIEDTLNQAKLERDDVKYYILHQANERIIQSVAKRLDEPIEKFPMNLSEYGNTSAASIPILLNELAVNGKLLEGDILVMSGFGAGLTWGSLVLSW